MGDEYAEVPSGQYRARPGPADYNLTSLHQTFVQHLEPHLHGITVPDNRAMWKAAGIHDEIDACGTFQRVEVARELRRMRRSELEGRLGISGHKVEEILRRAEQRTQELQEVGKKRVARGEIKYKVFLEVVREYRLNTEQESNVKAAIRVFAYVEEFNCRPPTLVMLGLTLLELAMFLYTSFVISQSEVESVQAPITWSGPVPYCSHLIYNPERRWEAWRFITYMFVHIGIGHFFFNMIMQILVGVFLEMEQEGWLGSLKVLVVYLSGVVAGSLGTSLSDPNTYIAGASGGVYALIAAHLATMTLNWQEDQQIRIQKVVKKPITKLIRIIFISLLTVHDVAFAVYVRFYDPDNRTGFMGHLCGALAGLTVGLFVLDNRRVRSWEPVVQWLALFVFVTFVTFGIVWNYFGEEWSPGFFPKDNNDLYERGSCSRVHFM